MKQKFLSLLIASGIFALPALAQTGDDAVINTGDFKKLSIAGNMNIVLLPAGTGETALSVNSSASEKLHIKMWGETMSIESMSSFKTATVYLKVNGLQKLSLGENTRVKTQGLLNSSVLNVYLESNAEAHLKTRGKIIPYGINDAEISVAPVTFTIKKAL